MNVLAAADGSTYICLPSSLDSRGDPTPPPGLANPQAVLKSRMEGAEEVQ